jgi:carbonic anhydrase
MLKKTFFTFLISIFLTAILTIFSPYALALENQIDWGYGGVNNPTRWDQIDENYSRCASGKNQSPIDIDGVITTNPSDLEFNYHDTPLTVVNNGHSVQVNYESGSFVKINNQEYELLQFHFHTPSEHTIKHKASAMELHLVHKNSSGKLGVIGIMIEGGSQNPIVEEIWQHIPSEKGTNKIEDIMINAQDLLPEDRAYYNYTGSLTTPPCSEEVNWYVLTKPIELSEKQINQFQDLYQVNARSIQPLNRRIIQLHN